MPHKDSDRRREYAREWIRGNPDKAREAMRRWRDRHPSKHAASNRLYLRAASGGARVVFRTVPPRTPRCPTGDPRAATSPQARGRGLLYDDRMGRASAEVELDLRLLRGARRSRARASYPAGARRFELNREHPPGVPAVQSAQGALD